MNKERERKILLKGVQAKGTHKQQCNYHISVWRYRRDNAFNSMQYALTTFVYVQITRPPPNGEGRLYIEMRGDHIWRGDTIVCSNYLSFLRVPRPAKRWIEDMLQLGVQVDDILDFMDNPETLPAAFPRPPVNWFDTGMVRDMFLYNPEAFLAYLPPPHRLASCHSISLHLPDIIGERGWRPTRTVLKNIQQSMRRLEMMGKSDAEATYTYLAANSGAVNSR
jgi:hypothetical protein